jgi:hypothetical protein
LRPARSPPPLASLLASPLSVQGLFQRRHIKRLLGDDLLSLLPVP